MPLFKEWLSREDYERELFRLADSSKKMTANQLGKIDDTLFCHGTTKRYADKIVKSGLQPRGRSGQESVYESVPSLPDRVYVADTTPEGILKCVDSMNYASEKITVDDSQPWLSIVFFKSRENSPLISRLQLRGDEDAAESGIIPNAFDSLGKTHSMAIAGQVPARLVRDRVDIWGSVATPRELLNICVNIGNDVVPCYDMLVKKYYSNYEDKEEIRDGLNAIDELASLSKITEQVASKLRDSLNGI